MANVNWGPDDAERGLVRCVHCGKRQRSGNTLRPEGCPSETGHTWLPAVTVARWRRGDTEGMPAHARRLAGEWDEQIKKLDP